MNDLSSHYISMNIITNKLEQGVNSNIQLLTLYGTVKVTARYTQLHDKRNTEECDNYCCSCLIEMI